MTYDHESNEPTNGSIDDIDLSTLGRPASNVEDKKGKEEKGEFPSATPFPHLPLSNVSPEEAPTPVTISGTEPTITPAKKEEKEEEGELLATAPLPLPPLRSAHASGVAADRPRVTLPEDDDIFTPAPKGNPVLSALRAAGLYLREVDAGEHSLTCPWAHEHADGDTPDPAIYFEPTYQRPIGAFACRHKHAEKTRIDRLLDHLDLEASSVRCKPRIRLAPGEMVRIAERAEQVLASIGDFYQSGGAIVTVNITTLGDAAAVVVGEPTLSKALALAIDWERFDAKTQEWRRCDPTPHVIRLTCSPDCYHSEVESGSFMMGV